MEKLKNKDLERISIEEFKKSRKTPITIVLDNVRSSLNVGSVFRTSDAFLIEKIILCGITPTPPNKDIRKSALGSTNSVDWDYENNTIDAVLKLKKNNYQIIGVEQVKESTMLNNFNISKDPIAIIFGNEVDGVNNDVINLCNEIIEIPQFGTKHSLNISVSSGIVIWELWNKLVSFKN
ncbi:MAG: RNA methyltransferase [Flavobacteriales bacterium]|jgi:tRNA G18 (ribose-2'-O)-methylase SpoU|nr:RNA methyltransferase [Flavobacteriales bacterium]MDC0909059.1 RNA methyltransferase [Flavobacteriales bacterium]MDC3390033.1 RNA methyltransferase [Flavobacteriales bacterium]|tara:strand:+ start:149 stop:685 length:537 start_codon:yes stop_codon:yes gene_type:complete